ncbi:hypothetical protein D3C72_1688110 [compost metagenome]
MEFREKHQLADVGHMELEDPRRSCGVETRRLDERLSQAFKKRLDPFVQGEGCIGRGHPIARPHEKRVSHHVAPAPHHE